MLYKRLLRPLLFTLPPETAQAVAELALKRRFLWRWLAPALRVRNERLRTRLAGLEVLSPVGLAAGYDKSCQLLPSLAALGFGYLVAGTVTEAARPGNARPRVFRDVREESLVNALGFPGRGLEFAAAKLAESRTALGVTPVIVSVSGVTEDEIVRCHRRLEPLVDGVEVNISSPNTAGLRVFQEPERLQGLLRRIDDDRSKPLFVKLPPFIQEEDAGTQEGAAGPREAETSERVLALAGVCAREGVEGLTVANTWPVRDPRLAVGSGGLSGRPLLAGTLRMIPQVRAAVGDGVAINACGGISSGEDVWNALEAGADTVQLLTALIYQGPGLVRRVNRELAAIFEANAGGAGTG